MNISGDTLGQLSTTLWNGYVTQPFGWPVHLLLSLVSFTTIARGRHRWRADQKWLRMIASGESSDSSNCRASDLSSTLLSDGNGELLSPADAGELYELQIVGTDDMLGRISNLFLLTGVVGTLLGLLGATRSMTEGSQLTDTLASAFSAFSVTVVSVVLSAVTVFVQGWVVRADARNVRAFVLHWARMRCRALPVLTAIASGVGQADLTDVQTLLERAADALVSMAQRLEAMQGSYAAALERVQSDLEKPIQRAMLSFDRLDAKITELETTATTRLSEITGGFDGIRSDLADLGEIVSTCRRLEEAMDAISRAAAELPQNVAVSNTRYLDELGFMRNQFEETLKSTLNAVATLGGKMESLGDSLDGVVERYLQRLESATATHLERLTERLGNVGHWAPEVHAALEQMRPDAEYAAASLDLLRAQSTTALSEMRDILAQVVEQAKRLTDTLGAAAQWNQYRHLLQFVVFGALVIGGLAYLVWWLLL